MKLGRFRPPGRIPARDCRTKAISFRPSDPNLLDKVEAAARMCGLPVRVFMRLAVFLPGRLEKLRHNRLMRCRQLALNATEDLASKSGAEGSASSVADCLRAVVLEIKELAHDPQPPARGALRPIWLRLTANESERLRSAAGEARGGLSKLVADLVGFHAYQVSAGIAAEQAAIKALVAGLNGGAEAALRSMGFRPGGQTWDAWKPVILATVRETARFSP